MNELTLERMYALRLLTMVDKLKKISKTPKYTRLSWVDALALLVDSEYDSRGTKRISTLQKINHS